MNPERRLDDPLLFSPLAVFAKRRKNWTTARRYLSYSVRGICALLCLLCAVQASKIALSKFYSRRAAAKGDMFAAMKAVSLAPIDPETYRTRARLLINEKKVSVARDDFSRALALSPADWKLWVELGDAQKKSGDVASASGSYAAATRRAPGYAATHWLLANCLLEEGRIDDAFAEFHQASEIRPSLFSQVLELAWQSYNGDVRSIERVLQPTTVEEKISLAKLLSKQGRAMDAVLWMRAAGSLPEDEKASLLRELLDSQKFEEAYAVWSSTNAKPGKDGSTEAAPISNGGFEDEIDLHDLGFGWQFRKELANVSTSLDAIAPHSGRYSLRVDWRGDPDRSNAVVQQLVLVSPKTRYRLKFAAHTESSVIVCAPQVTVVDGQAKALLTTSPLLTQEYSEWHQIEIEFVTGESKVITIGITLQAGSDGPCPIFGSTWFDDFSLEKI